MAATITIEQIKEFIATDLPDAVLNGYIAFVAHADTCLDSNSVPGEIQTVLKLNAIAHLITQSSGASGEVTSERSRTGAAVTYKETQGGTGTASTSYGRVMQQLDLFGCLTSLFKQSRFINAIGRGS